MLKLTSFILLVALSVVPRHGLATQSKDKKAKRVTIDRVVAVIEDEIITLRELEEQAAAFMEQLNDIDDKEAREKRRHEILLQVLDIEISERMVEREIEANKETLAVGEKEVDQAIEEVLRLNNLNREQLQSALYAQSITWSEYRKKLREQLERTRLIQYQVQAKIQVREEDVKRRCLERSGSGAAQQTCAAHILFAVPDDAPESFVEKQRAKATQLQAELGTGADFAAYALRYADDKSAPDGYIGCFGRGEMVDSFEKAAFALKVGEVSKVVRTQFGFHIIRVTERKSEATACNSNEDLAPFRNELYQEEFEHQSKLWVQGLRKKAFVEVRL